MVILKVKMTEQGRLFDMFPRQPDSGLRWEHLGPEAAAARRENLIAKSLTEAVTGRSVIISPVEYGAPIEPPAEETAG